MERAEKDKIIVQSADWLYNCGILGLCNILKHNKSDGRIEDKEIILDKDTLTFPENRLDNFSEKYFKYLIDTYEKTFSIYRITSFKSFLEGYWTTEFRDFKEESLARLNSQIEQTKKYMKSNSYVSAYSLIHSDFKPLEIEKQLEKISLKKNETISGRIEDIKKQTKLLQRVVEFFESPEVKKYIAGKNAMYTVINNAWDKISILNPQTKNPDMYDEFQTYFVETAKEYQSTKETGREKYKYRCICCNSKIKSMDIDLSFMREIGFDTNRKTSHVWDFYNYAALCPVCRLVYACVPAGFVYLYNRGIFVNHSMDLEELARINNLLKKEVLNAPENNSAIYQTLYKQMNEKFNEKGAFELSDIQVVRFKRDEQKINYTFSILSKAMLLTAENCKRQFNQIRNGSYFEGNTTFYIYNEVIKKLLNNENQFLLINKLIHYKLSMPDTSKYNMNMVKSVLDINTKFLKEAGYMEKDNLNINEIARRKGFALQRAYGIDEDENGNNATNEEAKKITESKDKNEETGERKAKYNKKLDSIAYRLLNTLRTDNKHLFMETMIKAHMYVQMETPSIFTEYLDKDKDLEFKNMGYAFITGMLGNTSKKNETYEGGETNEN